MAYAVPLIAIPVLYVRCLSTNSTS